MRAVVIVVAAAIPLLSVACGGESSEEGTSTRTSSPEVATSVATEGGEAIVSVWERETTCAELVGALKQAGLGDRAAEFVAGNGFVLGVQSADQLEDPSRPCEGAVPRKHSHFFTKDGAFGSRDWNGEDVDDGTYRVKGATVTISKEFPDVTFRYRIEGETITFDPVIPDKCATFRCAWSVSMAYPGRKWTRVE